MDSFPNPVRVSFRSEQTDLLRQPCDVGGEGEELRPSDEGAGRNGETHLGGELLAELVELGIILSFWLVSILRWLRF